MRISRLDSFARHKSLSHVNKSALSFVSMVAAGHKRHTGGDCIVAPLTHFQTILEADMYRSKLLSCKSIPSGTSSNKSYK